MNKKEKATDLWVYDLLKEANSSVKSNVLNLLPKLKTEETDSLCVT